MAKATNRKHAVHHKKARAHPAVKAHARRSSVSSSPPEVKLETEVVDEEFAPRSASRVVDDDLDETGIYGSGRDDATGRDEATS
jgi:hypothetical protein